MNPNRKLMRSAGCALFSTVFALIAIGGTKVFGAPAPIAIIMGLTTFAISMACIPMEEPEVGKNSENSAQEAAQRLKQDKETRP